MATDSDCRRIGIERCGRDVTCALCAPATKRKGWQWESADERAADTYLATPYFDSDGNEGTLDEVQSC